jgi:hypothetical protein
VFNDKKQNAYFCSCSCTDHLAPDLIAIQILGDYPVCMSDTQNPNLANPEPSDSDLEDDCAQRVFANVASFAQCTSEGLEDNCSCAAHRGTAVHVLRHYHPACDLPCPPSALDCEDPKTASFAASNLPVCVPPTSDPPVPVPDPLGAVLLGHATACDVDGTVDLTVGGKTASPGAHGVVQFTGGPCSGGLCPIGMYYVLNMDDFNVEGPSFGPLELGEVRFREMQALGASVPDAGVLDESSGEASLPAQTVLTAGRGVAIKVPLIGSNETEVSAVLATNTAPVEVTVRRGEEPPTCSLIGALAQNEDFSAVLEGTLVNQPPTADAGIDREFECTSPEGADVTLDGAASEDADENIASVAWRLGGRGGAQVGSSLVSHVDQSLGSVDYLLTVLDAFGQLSQDAVSIDVVDTTKPEIDCNAPPTITPRDAPVSFTASASDICDDSLPLPQIGTFSCLQNTKKGRPIDKRESCIVSFEGDTITIWDSGGVGDRIEWHVEVRDASNNLGEMDCAVEVIRPTQ